MGTQYFDDGSSITDDGGMVYSTPAPAGALISDYSNNFSPAGAASGATNWEEVLKFGFGRVIDYATATQRPMNAAPSYVPPQQMQFQQAGAFGISRNTLMLAALAGGAFFLVNAMKNRKKG